MTLPYHHSKQLLRLILMLILYQSITYWCLHQYFDSYFDSSSSSSSSRITRITSSSSQNPLDSFTKRSEHSYPSQHSMSSKMMPPLPPVPYNMSFSLTEIDFATFTQQLPDNPRIKTTIPPSGNTTTLFIGWTQNIPLLQELVLHSTTTASTTNHRFTSNIILYDPILPNTRLHRTHIMQQLSLLYKSNQHSVQVATQWNTQVVPLLSQVSNVIVFEAFDKLHLPQTYFSWQGLYEHTNDNHIYIIVPDNHESWSNHPAILLDHYYSQVSTHFIQVTATKENQSFSMQEALHIRQVLEWNHDRSSSVVGTTLVRIPTSSTSRTDQNLPTTSLHNDNNPQLPCIVAPSSSSCVPTLWDTTLQTITQRLSYNCTFVVYQYDFSNDISDLESYPTNFPAPEPIQLCRMAFVSTHSQLWKTKVKQDNGAGVSTTNVTVNGWTVVGVPKTHAQMTDAELAVLLIDPSNLFADSVTKYMMADWEPILSSSDFKVSRFMQMQTEIPANPTPNYYQRRPGTNVGRTVPLPPRKARKVIFFSDEEDNHKSADPSKYYSIPENQEDGSTMPPVKQLEYYRTYAKLVQDVMYRSYEEIESTLFRPFPFTWMEFSFLVQNRKSQEAQELRREWFQEYLYWGSNRDMEKMSLAFILGKRKVAGRLGKPKEEESSWYPLQDESGEKVFANTETELYIRLATRS